MIYDQCYAITSFGGLELSVKTKLQSQLGLAFGINSETQNWN
jgi:hypothetical protein